MQTSMTRILYWDIGPSSVCPPDLQVHNCSNVPRMHREHSSTASDFPGCDTSSFRHRCRILL